MKQYCGLVHTEDLLGGLWVPGDGVANPHEICLALGCEAMDKGVRVVEQVTDQSQQSILYLVIQLTNHSRVLELDSTMSQS